METVTSTRDRIALQNHRASLIVGGREHAKSTSDEVRELIFVHAGTDLFATEADFVVVRFPSSVWVIPEDTPGLDELVFGAWFTALRDGECVFKADLDTFPRPWRARWLGIPLPTPRLGVFPESTLPRWQSKSRIAIADLPRPETAGNRDG